MLPLLKICFLFIILYGNVNINAQTNYTNAFGVSIGDASGLTFKHMLNTKKGIDLSMGFPAFNGVLVSGLYEIHHGLNETDLLLYYGCGAHIGTRNYGRYHHQTGSIGIDGIIGAEYSFTEAPINIAIDWKPSINFASDFGIWPFGFGVSLRLIIAQPI